ncbi:TetR/AcrR family transcriptional regulator [Streptomyces fradiae]|uniref:TetR/AcrR family transcriptional regulator n=1 Tax=Streptomyces fradiae TaxID=1906 RepID=UPI0029437671|nr:TetR/AcrR family transcriptional regulator [Streptomyces fradiae]WOI63392.1 TetR/AcrR family transcriptional regulator [Streptomyces fradiae]
MSETSKRPATGVRQERKRRTRQALLDAARRVLERRGMAGLTTREVAAEAGVAAGTFFVHFPDLATLVETLLDEHVGQALDTALRTLPDGDLVTRLVHVAARLYESYDREPELSRQYISAALFHRHPDGPTERRMAEFRAWVTGEFARAAEAGAAPGQDPALAFTAYFSLYFGVLVAGLRGELDRDGQVALLEAALRRLVHGTATGSGTGLGTGTGTGAGATGVAGGGRSA